MKRGILALVILVSVCIAALAESGKNHQKIYPVDSDVYQAITALYISQGLALPSTTGPWSEDELLKMLDKIDTDKLSGGTLAAYQYAVSELYHPTPAFKFGLTAAVEAYYHTNTTDFTDESDWVVGYQERKPFLDIVLETWPGEHFYGYSSFSLGNSCYNGWNSTDGYTSTLFGQYALTTNIPLVLPAVMNDVDFNFPYRAFELLAATDGAPSSAGGNGSPGVPANRATSSSAISSSTTTWGGSPPTARTLSTPS